MTVLAILIIAEMQRWEAKKESKTPKQSVKIYPKCLRKNNAPSVTPCRACAGQHIHYCRRFRHHHHSSSGSSRRSSSSTSCGGGDCHHYRHYSSLLRSYHSAHGAAFRDLTRASCRWISSCTRSRRTVKHKVNLSPSHVQGPLKAERLRLVKPIELEQRWERLKTAVFETHQV